MYAEFELLLPETRADACAALARGAEAGAVMPLAGGTNLVVDMRARRVHPSLLVGLERLADLRGIELREGRVVVGARTTVSDLLHSPVIAAHGASLVESARVFAGQMVRNAATVAGNICCGSPAADLAPPLLALDAELTLEGTAGVRTVPLTEFYTGFKQNALAPGELLTELSWPIPPNKSADCFYKLARRKGDAIAVVGVAVALALESGRCQRARIALGAVAPVVMRATVAEAMLEGEVVNPALIEAAAHQAEQDSNPIDDVRASAAYRRHGVHVLTRRLLTRAAERLA